MIGILLLAAVPLSSALLCYETQTGVDGKLTGTVELVNRTEARLCVFVPGQIGDWSSGGPPLSLFPIGALEDSTADYEAIFALSAAPHYGILSLCILEEYKFGTATHMFRCFCRTDRCNKAMDLPSYLERQTEL